MSQTPSETKKRGRPSKPKQIWFNNDEELRPVDESPDKLVKEVQRLVTVNLGLSREILALELKVVSLNKSIVGYEAVCSYLEHRITTLQEK